MDVAVNRTEQIPPDWRSFTQLPVAHLRATLNIVKIAGTSVETLIEIKSIPSPQLCDEH